MLVIDPGSTAGPDWVAYYRKTIGREPRPLFERGMKTMSSAGSEPGQAVEVGFGDGTETVALLGAGWSVLAIDATPQAAEVLGPQVPDDAADRLVIRIASAEMVEHAAGPSAIDGSPRTMLRQNVAWALSAGPP